ncbi:hypothetical protein [Sphingobium sp. SCG-1]|uniref:hypothetical protein n=1 Tax=Sphingobium sp. SCG-1 TaxID=2072936 RepID=UPI0011AB7364|nr:hypothetical protein [Sphingobium sp. SCG-1]
MTLLVRNSFADKLKHLVSKLPEHFNPTDDGLQILTWSGEAIRSAIASCFHCPNDMHPLELNECIRKATRAALSRQNLSSESFQSTLNATVDSFRQTPKIKYAAWTKINFNPAGAATYNFFGSKICIGSRLPSEMREWQAVLNRDGDGPVQPIGGVLRCEGLFRSAWVAGYELTDKIEKFGSFINFWNNTSSGLVFPESSRAIFKLGPTFALYNYHAKKYDDTYWTNETYDAQLWSWGANKLSKLQNGIETLHKLNRKRNGNPLLPDALHCMALLNNSWLIPDPQRAVMSVWMCFERLLSHGSDGTRGGYEAIARRGGKFDADSRSREYILLALASHRNNAAHGKGIPGEAQVASALYQECARYLIWLIRWAIHNGSRFQTKNEFLEWVDIPKESERLLHRKKLHNLAMTFWHPRREQ